MSSTASVPNSFANAVTATGAQLDANYTTIVAYLNDPTNRNNYAVDGAATNTVVLNFSPPVVGGYTAGLDLCWKWGVTNTGAVVVNANGNGNASLVNPDGTSLSAGQGVAGSIGRGVYDGTRFIFISSGSTPASAAQVSAAVTLVPYVSPGRMQNHPGVAKAWCNFTGTSTGTIASNAGYNVSSIVRSGAGQYTIAFSTPMSSSYCAVINIGTPVGSSARFALVNSQTPGSVAISLSNAADSLNVDALLVNFVAFGSQ